LKGLEVVRPNQVWVADITYIRIVVGFLYLAVVLDLYSRKVIGWALSDKIDAELSVEALRMALEQRVECAPLTGEKNRELEGGVIGPTSG
jgi:transposase InsO family protein